MINSEVSDLTNQATQAVRIATQQLPCSGDLLSYTRDRDPETGKWVVLVWSDRAGDNEPFVSCPGELFQHAVRCLRWALEAGTANLTESIRRRST